VKVLACLCGVAWTLNVVPVNVRVGRSVSICTNCGRVWEPRRVSPPNEPAVYEHRLIGPRGTWLNIPNG